MDVLSSPAASQAAAPSAGGNAQVKGTGDAAFAQTLNGQLNNGQAGAGTGTTTPANTTDAAALGTIRMTTLNVAGLLGETNNQDLLAAIDGLLEQIDELDTADTDEAAQAQLADLQAMLEQMQALLALLGSPLVTLKQPDEQLSSEELVQAADAGTDHVAVKAQIALVKHDLENALIQLANVLEQGSAKRVQQQEPSQLIAQQLEALQKLLQKQKEAGTADRNNSNNSNAQAIFEPAAADETAPQQTAAWLQRLNQQSQHTIALKSAVAEALSAETLVEETADTADDESVLAGNLNANFAHSLKQATTSVATRAVAQPFVLADQFAESMTGLIVQKFDIFSLNGKHEAKIMLFPEQLGQVDVRITMQNGQLTALFHTDTVMAKDMLDNQMSQLRQALQSQGLTIDKLEVTQGQAASELSNGGQGQGSNQQFTNRNNNGKGGSRSDEAAFEADVIEQIAIQDMGYGRAVNATV
ncbi:flagellar hook-length control protein FliK [Paenibacillus sp. FSL H8-0537]|uniref:flagellar hook-length control protein FliK n=1 Tax=Paenibacillus sp. FSL H8-0537 TaxID=2921399 RepID=UPI003100FCE6